MKNVFKKNDWITDRIMFYDMRKVETLDGNGTDGKTMRSQKECVVFIAGNNCILFLGPICPKAQKNGFLFEWALGPNFF